MKNRSAACVLLFACAVPPLSAAEGAPLEARIDRVFSSWTKDTPGCVVAIARGGTPAMVRSYGMADLEHDVPNQAGTIFEAGSVSKQFTAFAVKLLERDGKLALDDQVRKYIPELPDYGAPLTIRHMLNHTSGLRDWGSMAALAGWPRGTRAYTQDHMLAIVTRQQALNFAPGTRWSYSNSGYNLAKTIVERVSGMSFSQFTRERIFTPLGMHDSSWRDDYTRIVKRRALAYDQQGASFVNDMPFENVVGNGGLLTTVGDLLKWNANFDRPTLGDARLMAEMQQPGAFHDGRLHDYGMGLQMTTYRGVPVVSHGGATAGYRSFLARYPAQQASVALLCNAGSANAAKLNNELADIVLEAHLQAPAALAAGVSLPGAELDRMAGLYRDQWGNTTSVTRRGDAMLVNERTVRVAGPGRLERGDKRVLEFDGKGGARALDQSGTVLALRKVAPDLPSAARLREVAGVYTSGEAESTLAFAVEQGVLTVRAGPGPADKLAPVYRDAYRGELGMVLFRRDARGKVIGLSAVGGRAWDVRYTRRM